MVAPLLVPMLVLLRLLLQSSQPPLSPASKHQQSNLVTLHLHLQTTENFLYNQFL